MIKINKSGVEFVKNLSGKGSNTIALYRCPICGQLFTMYRSHFYRGSNACKCRLPISERLYNIWINIKTRCNNPKSSSCKYYYNRGIKMRDEWNNSYKVFEFWAINNGYKENLTIDRINNNLGYFPDNCRWVDYYVQNNNKSNNIKITINGTTNTLKQWSCLKGINYKTLMSYYYRHGLDKTKWYIEDKIKMLEK